MRRDERISFFFKKKEERLAKILVKILRDLFVLKRLQIFKRKMRR